MDNLIFEKIWIDSNPIEDLFQIKISGINDRITMSSEVYAQTSHMNELKYGAKNILSNPFSVTMGCDGDSWINCVKLSFTSNARGIILISVYMSTWADEDMNDTAHFTLLTDVASLDTFSSKLSQICSGPIGEIVRLHD